MTDHNEGCQILQSGICTCNTPILVLNSPSYLLTDTMRQAMEAAWFAGNRAPRGEHNPYSKDPEISVLDYCCVSYYRSGTAHGRGCQA